MVKTIRVPGKGHVQIYSDTEMFISIPGDGPVDVDEVVVAAGAGSAGNDLLMEAGTYLLMETGDYLLMEA